MTAPKPGDWRDIVARSIDRCDAMAERMEAKMGDHVTGHFDRRGVSVECAVCRCRKLPIGRSAPMSMHGCSYGECPGYRQEPYVGSLWPGETASAFGYPVGSAGTEIVWVAYPEGSEDE